VSQISRRKFLGTAALSLTALEAAPGKILSRMAGIKSTRGVAPSKGLGPERLRGITVDAARLPEKLSYYHDLIDFCREWKLNALLFRLTDDQGSALRFTSHPELVTHRHALTAEEARGLAAYGARQGVMVIPEVESFGHTRYITAVPKYAHLEDRDPLGLKDFTGLIPVDPESLALISDLYREVAGIFPSPYLHGGCDEVNWGGSELSRRALRSKSRAEIWAEYLNSLDEVCRRTGKELIVWGDFVVHKQPDILPRLSKRVIVMDWQYYITDPKPLAQVAGGVIGQGLRVVGAPAIISCEWGPRIGDLQLRNIDAYSDAYAGIRDARCLGAIVTNWVPSRYIQRSLWDSIAYSAVALHRGSVEARQSAFRSFVEKFYQARWNSTWQEMFAAYYRIAPNRHSCAPAWQGPPLPVPWASEGDLRKVIKSGTVEAPPYSGLQSMMQDVESHVRSHHDDFSALALSAEYLGYAFRRETVVHEAKKAASPRAAAKLIENIARRDRLLVEKLDADWNTGRFSDSEGKTGPVFGLGPPDQLLFRMRLASEFSNQLAHQGGQFHRLLTEHS